MDRSKMTPEELNAYIDRLELIVNSLEPGVMLHEVCKDGSYKIVYASESSSELSGKSIGKFKEDLDQNNHEDMVEEDIPYVTRVVTDAVYGGKPLNVSYRIYDKDKNIIWLNMKGKVIGEQNGHPLLLSVYENYSEATASYEETLDELRVGVVIVDKNTQNMLYINKSAEKVLDELFHGSLKEFFYDLIKKIVPDQELVLEKDISFEATLNDVMIDIRLISRPWNGRETIMCFIEDVLDR